jgi:hypothetical protein
MGRFEMWTGDTGDIAATLLIVAPDKVATRLGVHPPFRGCPHCRRSPKGLRNRGNRTYCIMQLDLSWLYFHRVLLGLLPPRGTLTAKEKPFQFFMNQEMGRE